MNKFAQLFTRIDNFYKYALWEYRLTKSADDTSSLLAQAEEYDIKDEELYNQFESFMSAYKELIESLTVAPSHLNSEAMEDSAQLIDVLNTRYERIIKNPYLNVNDADGFDEDFDPGEFTSFIQKVVNDAENKLQDIAGEEIDIGEMRSAQFAQEFNQSMIDRGDKNITFTGDKVQQLLEARKNWFQNLMFIKKVGKSHPEYDKFQRYMETRHNTYQNIISDPTRRESYRKKAKDRQAKWSNKLKEQKKLLDDAWANTKDPKKREEIARALVEVNKQLTKRKEKKVEIATKVRELKQSKTLAGLIIHLQQRLATQKNEVAKAVKAKASKDPFFIPFKQAVQSAKEQMDSSPSPANQNNLEAAIRKEAEAIKNYLDNHSAVTKVKEDMFTLYAFRDDMKALNESKVIEMDEVHEDMKPHLHKLIMEGEGLISLYSKFYRSPVAAIQDILNLLKSKL